MEFGKRHDTTDTTDFFPCQLVTDLLRTCRLCYGLVVDLLWGNWCNGFWPGYSTHNITSRLLPFCITAVVSSASAGRGVVYKVAVWRSGSGRIHFVTVAVLRPFRHIVRPIWQMILHTTPDEVRSSAMPWFIFWEDMHHLTHCEADTQFQLSIHCSQSFLCMFIALMPLPCCLTVLLFRCHCSTVFYCSVFMFTVCNTGSWTAL